MGKRVRVGDLFLIPIDASRSGVGQLAGNWKGELYVIVYDSVYATDDLDPESIIPGKPLFAALTLDALIYHGDWRIIGNRTENLNRIPQPVFKVDQGGQVFLESRDRSISRPASRAEAAILKLRTVVAPVRLEKALKAHHGLGDWDAEYDELNFNYSLESSRLISN